MFLVSLKSSQWGGGALAWFHDIWTCSEKVLEYWMIFSLKIKLNHSWKFQRNWEFLLVLFARSQEVGLNGIYFVKFGLRMGEILNCILSLKIQINHKNQVLEGKVSWEHGRTWRSTIQLKCEKLGCAFAIVGKISMSRIYTNLFRKFWT